ncbi:ankyrin [Wilcoxina mikolae CBS 423.85]|nr:ankyrin [Wilcoxina mikolae CBS 423.85]
MVETERLEVLNLLLCQGVEVPELRHADQSLLLKMIGTGKFGTLKLLLDRGVDVSQLQRADESLLLENVRTGMLETVKLLLDRGWAEPDGKRKSEALFLAIAKGSEKITQLLLEHGYDSNNYDRFGRTPWDIANRPSIRALLRPSRDALEDKGFTCSTLTRHEHNLSTGWSCDICDRKLRDEFYYHCCQCSRACTKGPYVDSGYTYDMCADCATSKGCKAKGEIVHEHRRRFIGDGMLSFAELSPDDFQKLKPGVDVN